MSDAEPLVIDASIVVKWFLASDESGVAEARALLADHAAERVRLIAPTLLVHELMAVLVRRVPAPRVPEALDAFFDADVQLLPPDLELVQEAVRLVATCQTSVFDSAYAALASAFDCPLATADRGLATAVGGVLQVRLVP